MATEFFYVKQGDTLPLFRTTLKDAAGVGVNVTGSTVKLTLTNVETKAVKITEAAVALIDASNGVVEYTWVTNDTDTAGTFSAEFEVTTGGGAIHTFPNARQNQLLVIMEGEGA